MFGSEILEIAVGLALVYLLLSLICSALNECIARKFAIRAKTLEIGVRNLLQDPKLAEKVYEHPLIKGLTGKKNLPSYIPARTFALTLFDTFTQAGRQGRSQDGKDKSSGEGVDQADTSVELQRYARSAFENLENGIKTIESPQAKQALQAMLNSVKAETDQWDKALAAARTAMENWFDDSMDRVSGWYKRKMQWIILALAFLVACALNADTIMMANYLSKDATLRASVVATAVETVKKAPAVESDTPLTRINELRDELRQLGLPIGWHKTPEMPQKGISEKYHDPREAPNDLLGWLSKLGGLLLTTIAVSLGAPFWFDMLNKLVNLRGTGKKPEEKAGKK